MGWRQRRGLKINTTFGAAEKHPCWVERPGPCKYSILTSASTGCPYNSQWSRENWHCQRVHARTVPTGREAFGFASATSHLLRLFVDLMAWTRWAAAGQMSIDVSYKRSEIFGKDNSISALELKQTLSTCSRLLCLYSCTLPEDGG